jgi:hypothetical protein
MQILELAPVVNDGFTLDPKLKDGELEVSFSGNADMSAVAALGVYLKQVHSAALDLVVSHVNFDFSNLYFMNSSCFKAFVTWIDTVGQTQPLAYGIRFRTNPKLHWQRRSLEALRCLAPGVVQVENPRA